MKRLFLLTITSLGLLCSSRAQIIVEGKNTYQSYFNNTQSAVSISYGGLFWVDAKQKDLFGYSKSREPYKNDSFSKLVKKFNVNQSFRLGFEKGISEKFSIKTYITMGKLITGASLRADLSVSEKSKVFQLSTYGNLILSKPKRKFKVHYLFGPEFLLVDKDVIIRGYIEKQTDTPTDFYEKESILEVGLTTGLGFSYDISHHIGLFTDGLIGFSFPGGGFKATSSGCGLRYIF